MNPPRAGEPFLFDPVFYTVPPPECDCGHTHEVHAGHGNDYYCEACAADLNWCPEFSYDGVSWTGRGPWQNQVAGKGAQKAGRPVPMGADRGVTHQAEPRVLNSAVGFRVPAPPSSQAGTARARPGRPRG